MVSADIHGMETPSPLPTPGYLPLLSEASTPMTPATMQGTPLSISPGPANSPRISFRSFTLPLDVDEHNCTSMNDEIKNPSARSSSEKLSRNPSHRLSSNLDDRISVSKESHERSETRDRRREEKSSRSEGLLNSLNSQDQEMVVACESSSSCGQADEPRKSPEKSSTSDRASLQDDEKSTCQIGESCCEASKELDVDALSNSKNDDAVAGASSMRINEQSVMKSPSNTDLDSPMSCEQTIEDLPDSGFVICDSSEKMFTNTETQNLATNTNDSGEWVMIERTTESVTTPSEASSPKDPLEGTVNLALATDPPRLRSTSDNISRTSLDLTMGSTVDTDTSCIGASDLTESPVLVQESADMSYDVVEAKRRSKETIDDDSNEILDESFSMEDRKYGSDRRNGNDRPLETDLDCARMEQENDSGNYGTSSVIK